MNERYKFRAWLKKEKKMVEVVSINFNDKVIAYNDNEKQELCINCSFEDVELMQYTGLKDRNGVEIFEGDIVELWYDFENEYFEERTLHSIGIIKFDKGIFTVEFEGYDYYINADGLKLETIGNIYENYELLEEKMLKIKDNVDLKELEKYGFTIEKETGAEAYFDFVPYNKNDNYNSSYVLINKYGKIIDVEEIQREHANSLIDLIYDLIQADLIEKVER